MNKESISRVLEAFAYIAKRAPANKNNMYNVLKVFYIADKIHMERFGRFIFDDSYSAMPKGPVPSSAYDLIKNIKAGRELPFNFSSPVYLSGNTVVTLRDADEDFFSGSDLLCLNEVIARSENEDLGDLSHDDAWKATAQNRLMSDEAIIATLHNSESLLNLHQNRHL
jgi:uncharacterized phage-associated protein